MKAKDILTDSLYLTYYCVFNMVVLSPLSIGIYFYVLIFSIIPFAATGKCFLVVIRESIKKRKNLIPLFYSGWVKQLVYSLIVVFFISAAVLLTFCWQ